MGETSWYVNCAAAAGDDPYADGASNVRCHRCMVGDLER